MDDFRERAFLHRVRAALGHPRRRTGPPAPDPAGTAHGILQTIANRNDSDYDRLLDRLAAAAPALNLRVTAVPEPGTAAEAIAGLVREKQPEWGSKKQVAAWDHPLIGSLNLPQRLSRLGVPVTVTVPASGHDRDRMRRSIRRDVEAAYVGITSADFCIADTATLVMKTRPGHARMVSLVPSIHVAVIAKNQLIADLKELYTLLCHDPFHRSEGLTNCMTFISGPSKTADIEATLVHGAHGPREVHIVVITG